MSKSPCCKHLWIQRGWPQALQLKKPADQMETHLDWILGEKAFEHENKVTLCNYIQITITTSSSTCSILHVLTCFNHVKYQNYTITPRVQYVQVLICLWIKHVVAKFQDCLWFPWGSKISCLYHEGEPWRAFEKVLVCFNLRKAPIGVEPSTCFFRMRGNMEYMCIPSRG